MRPDWHLYFLSIADIVSTRATCDRLHVGCVLVSEDQAILATGYNGSVRGAVHCDTHGHELDANGSCVRTAHAEANAIAQAARHGMKLDGATAYVNYSPCYYCQKLLANAGISRVIYSKAYSKAYRVDPAICSASIHARTGMKAYSVEEYAAHLDLLDWLKRA